jgi:hypothetical protein
MRRFWFVLVLLSLTRVALAGSVAPTLRIDGADGTPGEEVTVSVELDSGDAGTVLEVFNEIAWNPLTPVRKLSNGEPDCFADIRVVPNFASFTCTNEACTSLHAEVRSQGQPLADGPVYGCIFVIDPDTPAGDYPLDGSAAMWADAERQVHAANSDDGLIRVANPTPTPTPTATPTAPLAISARSSNALPGGNATLPFDFTDTTGRAVDTGFDVVVENAVFDLGTIDCTLDARLTNNRRLTVLPLGNEEVPAGFSRVRFNVFNLFKPVTTIESGLLLSCTVPVRADAPLGASRIDLQRVFAEGPDGLIPGIVAIDGFLVVTTGSDTPTSTPTAPPTPTPTPPPTIPCVGDCDENGIADVYEAILSIRIALEKESLETCEAIDANHDGFATADELVMAVGNLIDGCR